jgi:hypothetical protein
VSGQVGRFHSLEELLAFMIRVLTEVWCVRKLCPRMWTCYLVKSPNRVVWAVAPLPYTLAKRWAAHGKRLIPVSPPPHERPLVFKPSAIAHTTAVHDRERKGDSTDAYQRTPGVPHRPMAVLGMVLGWPPPWSSSRSPTVA